MTARDGARGEWLPASVLALGALALYLLTLEPGLLGGDSAEAQFVPYLLGIPHFTGYPLFTMAGKLWTLLVPVGEIAWRMNLLSAVMGAASVGLVYLVVRELEIEPAPAVLGAALYAVVPLVWYWSTRAGVRAMHLFFVALILWLALRWVRDREPGAVALALAVGLSLAHHRTTVLLLPGLALLALWKWRSGWRPVSWGRLAAAVALPQLLYLYLYLPLRSSMQPAYAFAPVHGWDEFWGLVTAASLKGYVLSLDAAEVPGRIAALWEHLTIQLGALGAVVGLAGLAVLAGRRHAGALLVVPSWLLMAGFTIVYKLDSPELNVNFLLPAHLILAMGVGVAVGAVGRGLAAVEALGNGRRAIGPRGPAAVGAVGRGLGMLGVGAAVGALGAVATRRWLVPLLAVVLLAAPIESGWVFVWERREGPLDPYREVLRGDQASRLVELGLERVKPNAIVVADWEQAAAFLYYQLVEGVRPDVTVRYPVHTNLAWTLESAGDRPVYLARLWPGLGERQVLSAEGPLIEVVQEPRQSREPVDVFDRSLALLGFEIRAPRGGVLPVELEWAALQELPDLSVSLRLYDASGQLVAQRDHDQFVMGSYPTSRWEPGVSVTDYFELPLPERSGELRLGLIVYQAQGDAWRNLRTRPGEEILWVTTVKGPS